MSERAQLPIDPYLDDIAKQMRSHANLVLVASPGAGKTTRVPVALLMSQILSADAPGILVLEPRRLAARAAAARIASEQGWSLGGEVGYQVRFENKTSANTRLTVLTEGLLNRRLARDPQLHGIGCVILDEFHERSWQADVGLGLLRELQALARPDLKILVMSATLQAQPVSRFLGEAPIVEVNVAAHPIEHHYLREPQLLATGPELTERVGQAVINAVKTKPDDRGHILVFLPGVREISRVAASLETFAKRNSFSVHALHGSLPLEEQDRVIRPEAKGLRKIILSTNIAETSLTIDGVTTVIDSGLARVMRSDAAGFPHLELSRISRFSSVQRAGRSGRQGPGRCFHLWNRLDEASMPEAEAPEIMRTDLSEACLLLAAQGISDFANFSWFEAPPENRLQSAQNTLEMLGAFKKTTNGLSELTEIGRSLLDWPLHPRLARMMEVARGSTELRKRASRLAAVISERDIVTDAAAIKHSSSLESDTLLRLELLDGRMPAARYAVDQGAVRSVERAAQHIETIAGKRADAKSTHEKVSFTSDSEELELLLYAFPDRVCRRRRADEAEARMVGGRGVKLHRSSSVARSELFLAVDAIVGTGNAPGNDTNDRLVTQASRIEFAWLKKHFPEHLKEKREAAFDGNSGRIVQKIFWAYMDLPLEEPRIAAATETEIAGLMPALVAQRWPEILRENPDALAWLERLHFIKNKLPEKSWPSVDFLKVDDEKTREIIEGLAMGERAPMAIAKKDIVWHFENALGHEFATLLNKEAPHSLTVPSGSRMRIRYPADREPYLEVRIQEIFGWTGSPLLAQGRSKLTLHLLGPNFRPVQVTSDLKSFWASGYDEVRKELRARYPKHSWPEDPLTARPEAKGRRSSR